jgi:hypothetical protein
MTRNLRSVVRGNPKIDKDIASEVQNASDDLVNFQDSLSGALNNLDQETLYRVSATLLRMHGSISSSLANIEDMKRVRIRQSTALVGGRRRKAKKS